MKRSYQEYESMGGDSPPVRSCQQCGATKTPQWREGPLGPKTLCNACGVKRVRMIKAQLEGRKPHNVSVGKRSTPQHTIHYAANREESAQVANALEMLANCAHSTGFHTPEPPSYKASASRAAPSPPRPSARPLRPAAARALQRVAEYDRLVDPDYEAPPVAKGSGGAGDSALPTDSGEEINWAPAHSPLPLKAEPSEEELSELEADAAANLLSMSCAPPAAGVEPRQRPPTPSSSPIVAPVRAPRSATATRAPPPLALSATAAAIAAAAATGVKYEGSPTPPLPGRQRAAASSAAGRSSSHPVYDPHALAPLGGLSYSLSQPQLAAPSAAAAGQRPLGAGDTAYLLGPGLGWLAGVVPGEAYQQLVGLKGEVEQCHQDLKAAEAAVEAVAKILADKEAAARRARAVSEVANRHLAATLARLNADYQLGALLEVQQQAAAEAQGPDAAAPAAAAAAAAAQTQPPAACAVIGSPGQEAVAAAAAGMASMLLGSSALSVTPSGVQGLGCGIQSAGAEGMEEDAGAALASTEEEDLDGCETGLPVVASLAAIAAAAALRRGGFAVMA